MKTERKKALKRQAGILSNAIDDQCTMFIKPYVFVKRINIDYSIPVLVTGNEHIHGITQLAWDEYEIFQMSGDKKSVKKEKKLLKKLLVKLLRRHDKIMWDITPVNFKRFQFSTKKVKR